MSGETNNALYTIPEAKAGIGISFSSKGAFVVQAEETYESSINSFLELQKEIISAYKDGRWDKKWTVIVKLVKTPTATFLISNSSSSKIELTAESELSIQFSISKRRRP